MGSYFSGRVHTVLYANLDFYVLKVVLDPQGDDTTSMFSKRNHIVPVRGTVPGLHLEIGSWFGFEGKWKEHPKYGRQLEITKAPVVKGGWDADTAVAMLSSHGVGEQVCLRLRNHFGDKLVAVLDTRDESKLRKVNGISPFSAAHIASRWGMLRSLFQTLEFLADAKVPKHKISDVWAHFGEEAQTVLSTNPWALVEVDGIRFDQADEVALRLNLDMNSPLRVQGAALYASKNRRGMGHLFLSSGDMLSAVRDPVSHAKAEDVARALGALHKAGNLVIDRTTRPGTTAIYEPWFLRLEQECAELLCSRSKTALPTTAPDAIPPAKDGEDKLEAALKAAAFKPYGESLSNVGSKADAAFKADPDAIEAIAKAAIEDWSEGGKISLSGPQRQGALNALTAPVSVLTGLPGTGKTTTLRAVVDILKDARVSFLLCAPTGIAAKRMSTLAGAPASTIHRAFKAQGWNKGDDREATYAGVVGDAKATDGSDGSGESWGFGPTNPYPAKVVICDEFSMVDQHLMYRLLTCTGPNTRLVMVGDPAQLPSVGPGNVLRDLISTELFPTVNLTEIFRQEETSDIVLAAHKTFRGEIPDCGSSKESDFILVEESDESTVLSIITKLVTRLYAKRENFQVLSPRHAGTLGVTNLNQRLRTILNPKTPGLQEMRLGNETVREDDRVMVVKNNYKLGIFNGDVGKVAQIDRRAREVVLKLHGPPVVHVRIPFKDAPKLLRLAYCVTVHKCVHPDTLVETRTQGLLPIRDIATRGDIATPDGERAYQSKVLNPEGPAVRVETRGGYTLTTTPDHEIDVWDGEQYVRREAGDLREGDLLRLRLGVTSEPVIPPMLPEAPGHDVRAKVCRLPLLMSGEVAEFLGLMVADGTVYPRGFRLAKRHKNTVDRFEELCALLFGATVHRSFQLGAYHAEVNSTFLSSWLSSVGGLDPHKKRVPDCVLRSHSGLHARFLRGLFADGSVNLKDGCLDHIEWTCSFDGVPDVVRTMLLRLRIPCGTTRNRGLHTIYVYGEYARQFGEIVGFPSEAKRARCLLPCGDQTKYFVPVARAEAEALRREHLDVLGHSTCGNVVQRGRLSLHKLNVLLDSGAASPVAQALQKRSQWHHEPVVSLEPVTCPSMCVEVPEGHRFLQNGFSAWNSQGQEYDTIVMPLVKGFGHQLQRNLFYTAITRARKRVLLVGQRGALVKAVLNNREDVRNTLFTGRLALASKGGSVAAAGGS